MNITYTIMLNGEEQDVDFDISADMIYEPAFVSGPMDACYPDGSECTITEIKVMSNTGYPDAEILAELEAQVSEDTIIEDLWDDYMLSCDDAAADAADYYYRDSREDR